MTIRRQIEKLFGVAFLDNYNVSQYFKSLSISGALDLKKTYEILVILINKIEEIEKNTEPKVSFSTSEAPVVTIEVPEVVKEPEAPVVVETPVVEESPAVEPEKSEMVI